MILSFRDPGVEDVFDGRDTRTARSSCPPDIWRVARRKLELLDRAEVLEDLRAPPGNRLEALRGDRKGQHSMRINVRYRICFVWRQSGPAEVEIVDYH